MLRDIDFGHVGLYWSQAYDLLVRISCFLGQMQSSASSKDQPVRPEDMKRIPNITQRETSRNYGIPLWTHDVWNQVFRLHPWYSRVWIIQELVLARDLAVRYGRFTIQWELVIGLRWFLGGQALTWTRMQPPNVISGLSSWNRLMEIQRQLYHGQLNALNLYWLTRDALTTNPRDKIIGLLGLLSPALHGFHPSYSWSEEHLAFELAKRLWTYAGPKLLSFGRQDHHRPQFSSPIMGS